MFWGPSWGFDRYHPPVIVEKYARQGSACFEKAVYNPCAFEENILEKINETPPN